MSTKPENDRRRVDNPLWEVMGWLVFEGTVLIARGLWALIVFLLSLVTD